MVRVRILRGSKSFATGLWVWSGSNFNRTNRTGFYAYAIWFHPDINNLSAILLVLKLDCWMFVFCLFCLFVSLSRINKTSLCANFQLSSSSKTENLHTGIFLTATTVYWFSKWNFGVLTSLDRYLWNNSHSFHLINFKFQLYIEHIGAHLCRSMGLLRHQISIFEINGLQMIVVIPN